MRLLWCVLGALAALLLARGADAQSANLFCQDSTGRFVAASPSNPCPVALGASVAEAITGVHSTALEASHVLKATPGAIYSVYASNLTGGSSGFLILYNATAAPAPGALTAALVLDCVPFSGGVAQILYNGIPPGAASVGIVALVSSATSCFTYTASTLTAYIKGMVQ